MRLPHEVVIHQTGQVYLVSGMQHRLQYRAVLVRRWLACKYGGTYQITIDFMPQAGAYVKIHPAVGGVQEVSMQLKWREHTLPAFFLYPTAAHQSNFSQALVSKSLPVHGQAA